MIMTEVKVQSKIRLLDQNSQKKTKTKKKTHFKKHKYLISFCFNKIVGEREIVGERANLKKVIVVLSLGHQGWF